MIRIFFLLVLSVFFTNAAQSDEIKTRFSNPFETLMVNETLWELQDNDKNMIDFELIEDSDVEFAIFRGHPFTKKTSLAKLLAQIEKAHGKLAQVPLLMQYFPDMEDDEWIDNWSKEKVKGIECIKFYKNIVITHKLWTDDKPPVFYETINRTVNYLTILENRIYLLIFEAPEEKFSELESLFVDTLQNL